MLNRHSNRVCTIFIADFEPLIGFARKLSDAAEAVQSALQAPSWGFGTGGYLLRHISRRFLFILEFRRICTQTLGLDDWQNNLSQNTHLIKTALEKAGVTKLKRLGFKTTAYLPQGAMSHAEICALMFGSFLAPATEIESLTGKPTDVLLHLYGKHKNMNLQLNLNPMTAAQVATSFMETPNLEQFVEAQLLDPGIREFKATVSVDCLCVEVDLHRKDVNVGDVALFLKESLDGTHTLTESAVHTLQSLRPKRVL